MALIQEEDGEPVLKASAEMEKRVAQYVQIRDFVRQMDENHKRAREPYTKVLDRLQGMMEEFLNNSGVKSAKTERGTFYQSTRVTATLADPEAFIRFVERTAKFDLLERRANATAVRDYVKENGALPPGCTLNQINTIGVRRPGAKKED